MAEKKLTQHRCEKLKAKGLYNDGGGLCLQVGEGGRAKSWIYRYAVAGRERHMGLGSFDTFNIDEARERARQCRQLRADGIDPIEHRKAERHKQTAEARLVAKKDVTFRECAEKYLAEQDWRFGSMAQAKRYFAIHIYPKIGEVLVSAIDLDHVKEVIKPILDRGLHSATSRTLSYLNCTLDFAKAEGFRSGDNPADLKGPLKKLMPRLAAARKRATKGAKGNPHLDYKRIAGLVKALRAFCYQGVWHGKAPITARALEFLILMGVRTHMITGRQEDRGAAAMRWNQIDWEDRIVIWTPDQHKIGDQTNTDYIVPLSDRAIEILKEMEKLQQEAGFYGQDKPVFVHGPALDKSPYRKPARVAGKPIDHNSLWVFLRSAAGEHGWTDKDGNRVSPQDGWRANDGRLVTPHGFRTTFGTWSVEVGGYPERDSEIALGHTVGGRVRNIYKKHAYRIEPRRPMMQDWANYCDDTRPIGGDNVVAYRKAK
jgi:integrase